MVFLGGTELIRSVSLPYPGLQQVGGPREICPEVSLETKYHQNSLTVVDIIEIFTRKEYLAGAFLRLSVCEVWSWMFGECKLLGCSLVALNTGLSLRQEAISSENMTFVTKFI